MLIVLCPLHNLCKWSASDRDHEAGKVLKKEIY